MGEAGRGALKTLLTHPEPNAQNCKREPEQLQQGHIAVYDSERHRLRRSCIPKILVKGHNSKTPELAEGAGGLIGLAVSLAEGPTG